MFVPLWQKSNWIIGNILAGEQGPSCKTLEQISDLIKVIHVRFVSCGKESVYILDNETSDNDDSFTTKIPKKKKASNSINSFILPPNDRTKPSSMPSFSIGMSETQKEEKAIYPKSHSISQMLKLGKLVKSPPGRKTLRLFHFDLANMTWSDIPTTVEGGFRSAHRATISTRDFSKKKWVVKKFLPATVQSINEDLHTTVENQAKKSIQMHYLAKKTWLKRCTNEFKMYVKMILVKHSSTVMCNLEKMKMMI